jgi:hypothetical protein
MNYGNQRGKFQYDFNFDLVDGSNSRVSTSSNNSYTPQ